MTPGATNTPATQDHSSPRTLVIEADGGSRGNPGVAGYGALVREGSTGQVLVELAEPLGKASNNVAEYSGLIAGLRAVLDIEPGATVTARMDSKLVVEQMAGRWKIKHEDMRRLALEARELCSQVRDAGGSVAFEWIPREKNKDADALSNEAMDGHSVHRVLGEGADLSSADTAESAESAGSAGSARQAAAEPTVAKAPSTVTTSAQGLRLLLVQTPSDPTVGDRVVTAVGRLVGAGTRVVSGSEPVAAQLGSAIAAALESEAVVDDGWLTPDGEGSAGTVRAAYGRLVATGGTVVVVTSRSGVLSVLAYVLGMPGDRFWAVATAPGSLSGVEVWPDGTASVAFTNRTDHLG